MKTTISTFCIAIIFIVFATKVIAQNFDTVQIKTNKITDKIYELEGDGGNIGVLLGNDGIVIIDDQFAPLSEKIRAALKALSDKPVRFVINTHFHGDHTGGNENFAGRGAIIVAQENSRLRMTGDEFMTTINNQKQAAPYDALPKVTFSESVTLHLNGETAQVFHVQNAHTDGDAIIYFKESNVFHAGDVFVRYGLPYIDQPHGGTMEGMIRGVDELLKLSNDSSVIIPGHGKLAGKKDVVEYKNMLVTIRDRIAKAIKEGKTVDEIMKADPTKEFISLYLNRKEFVKSVYDSMNK